MSLSPDIRYTQSADGTSLAYWVLSGPSERPLIFIPDLHLHNIALEAADPAMSQLYRQLSRARPLVRYDRRGVGLSDRPGPDGYRFSDHLDDLSAVIEAIGASEVDIWGGLLGVGLALDYTAANPERVRHVILWRVWGDYSRVLGTEPLGEQRQRSEVLVSIRDDRDLWATAMGKTIGGKSEAASDFFKEIALSAVDEYPTLFRNDDLHAHHTSPNIEGVECPVLILQPGSSGWPDVEEEHAARSARALSSQLRDARLRLLPESVGLPGFGDADEIASAVNEFLGGGAPTEPSRGLSTILFSDVVSSTEIQAELRDASMRELMRVHDEICRTEISDHGGRVVKTIGDGFMAEFGLPSGAVAAGLAIQQRIRESFADAPVPLRLRIGINAGEPVVEEDDLFGSSVVVAKRLESAAEPGDVLVSDVVRQAVLGREFDFVDRGLLELKGFADPVRAWSVRAPD